MDVLVIDIGGSTIKVAVAKNRTQFDSSPELGPEDLVKTVRGLDGDWQYDVISIGFPGKVTAEGPAAEPGNLGTGWVGFDYARALGKPVRVINDAVMQAVGAYEGGRMLFLGLGTGVGSALVTERVAVPLELGDLPYRDAMLADSLGREGLERDGLDRWRRTVLEVTPSLRRACLADYVVLGGGNAARVDPLPPETRRGGNDDAIVGGTRLWREIVEPHDREPSRLWRVMP
jgi:polyphosphate glucokinase